MPWPHPQGKCPKHHQCSTTIAACDSCLNATVFTLITPKHQQERLNVIIKSLINHCGMKNTQGKSEPSVVKNDSYTQQWVTMRHPAFCPLAFPAHTYCCPRCPFIKMRSLVRRVTVGHSFLWLMQFRRVRPNHSCTWHNVTTRPQFLLD